MSSRGLNIYSKWFRLITYHFGCSFPENSKISVQGGDLSFFMLHWTHVDGCEVLPHHIQVIVECTESILLQQVPFCICVHMYFLLHWAEYVHIHSTTSVAASFIKPNLMHCLHIFSLCLSLSLSLRHTHTHTPDWWQSMLWWQNMPQHHHLWEQKLPNYTAVGLCKMLKLPNVNPESLLMNVMYICIGTIVWEVHFCHLISQHPPNHEKLTWPEQGSII